MRDAQKRWAEKHPEKAQRAQLRRVAAVHMRRVGKLTYKEIGRELGVSWVRARQLVTGWQL